MTEENPFTSLEKELGDYECKGNLLMCHQKAIFEAKEPLEIKVQNWAFEVYVYDITSGPCGKNCKLAIWATQVKELKTYFIPASIKDWNSGYAGTPSVDGLQFFPGRIPNWQPYLQISGDICKFIDKNQKHKKFVICSDKKLIKNEGKFFFCAYTCKRLSDTLFSLKCTFEISAIIPLETGSADHQIEININVGIIRNAVTFYGEKDEKTKKTVMAKVNEIITKL